VNTWDLRRLETAGLFAICFQIERVPGWQSVSSPEYIAVFPVVLNVTSSMNLSSRGILGLSYVVRVAVLGLRCGADVTLAISSANTSSCLSTDPSFAGISWNCSFDPRTNQTLLTSRVVPEKVNNLSVCLNLSSRGEESLLVPVAVIRVEPTVVNVSIIKGSLHVSTVAFFRILGLGINAGQFFVVSGSADSCSSGFNNNSSLLSLEEILDVNDTSSHLLELRASVLLSIPLENILCHQVSSGREAVEVFRFSASPIRAYSYSPSDFTVRQFPVGGDVIIRMLGDALIDSSLDQVYLLSGDVECQGNNVTSPLWLRADNESRGTSPNVSYAYHGIGSAGLFTVCFQARFSPPLKLSPLLVVTPSFFSGVPRFVYSNEVFNFSVFGIGVDSQADRGFFVPAGASCNLSEDFSTASSRFSSSFFDVVSFSGLSSQVAAKISARGRFSLCWLLSTGSTLRASRSEDILVVPPTPTGVSVPKIRAHQTVMQKLLGSQAVDLVTLSFPDSVVICPDDEDGILSGLSIIATGSVTFNVSSSKAGIVRLCFRTGLVDLPLLPFANLTVFQGVRNASLSTSVVTVGGVVTITISGSALEAALMTLSYCNGTLLRGASVLYATSESIAWRHAFLEVGRHRICCVLTDSSPPDAALLGEVTVDPMVAPGVRPEVLRAGRLSNITLLDSTVTTVRIVRGVVDCSSIASGAFDAPRLLRRTFVAQLERGNYTVCAELLSRNISVGVLTVVGSAEAYAPLRDSRLYADFPIFISVTGAGLGNSGDEYYFVKDATSCRNGNRTGTAVEAATPRKVTVKATFEVDGLYRLCADVDGQGVESVSGIGVVVMPSIVLDPNLMQVFLQGPAADPVAAATYLFRFSVTGPGLSLSGARIVDTTALDDAVQSPQLDLYALPVGDVVIRGEVYLGNVLTATYVAQKTVGSGAENCDLPPSADVVGLTASRRREFAYGVILLHNFVTEGCSNYSRVLESDVFGSVVDLTVDSSLVTDPLFVFGTLGNSCSVFSHLPGVGVNAVYSVLLNTASSLPLPFTENQLQAQKMLSSSIYSTLVSLAGQGDPSTTLKAGMLLYDRFELLSLRSCSASRNLTLLSSGVQLTAVSGRTPSISLDRGELVEFAAGDTSSCSAVLSLSQNILNEVMTTAPRAPAMRGFSTEASESSFEPLRFDTPVVSVFGGAPIGIRIPIGRSCSDVTVSTRAFVRSGATSGSWEARPYTWTCTNAAFTLNLPASADASQTFTVAAYLSSGVKKNQINVPLLVFGVVSLLAQMLLVWKRREWLQSPVILTLPKYLCFRTKLASDSRLWMLGDASSRLCASVAIGLLSHLICLKKVDFMSLLSCGGFGELVSVPLIAMYSSMMLGHRVVSLVLLAASVGLVALVVLCATLWAASVVFLFTGAALFVVAAFWRQQTTRSYFLFLSSFFLRVVVAVAFACFILVTAVLHPPETLPSLIFLGYVCVLDICADTLQCCSVRALIAVQAILMKRESSSNVKVQPPTFHEPVVVTSGDSSDNLFLSFDSSAEYDSVPRSIRKGEPHAPDEQFEKVAFDIEPNSGEELDDEDFVFVKMDSPSDASSASSSEQSSDIVKDNFEDVPVPDWMSSDSDFDEVAPDDNEDDFGDGDDEEEDGGDDESHPGGPRSGSMGGHASFSNPSSLAWEGRMLPPTQDMTANRLEGEGPPHNPLDDFGPNRRPY
jgi:hypothetical protein